MIEDESEQVGRDLSEEEFTRWIEIAEKSPTLSLETFNKKWEEKKLKIFEFYQL